MDLADFLGIDRAAVEQGTENNRCVHGWDGFLGGESYPSRKKAGKMAAVEGSRDCKNGPLEFQMFMFVFFSHWDVCYLT